jgi:endonuclease V-like protein UPF0215 family
MTMITTKRKIPDMGQGQKTIEKELMLSMLRKQELTIHARATIKDGKKRTFSQITRRLATEKHADGSKTVLLDGIALVHFGAVRIDEVNGTLRAVCEWEIR